MPHKIKPADDVGEASHEQTAALEVDYNSPAELFPGRNLKGTRQVRYKRFDTAAEALRFAVEEMPAPALLGACLEVNEVRFGLQEIRHLYASAAYPLTRPATI